MSKLTSADVVIVGTGVVGVAIAEQLLDAGLQVLMLEAGPRVTRAEIVENFRNLPLALKGDPSSCYPPAPWAPHPMPSSDTPEDVVSATERPRPLRPDLYPLRGRFHLALGRHLLAVDAGGHAAAHALRRGPRLGLRLRDAGTVLRAHRIPAGHLRPVRPGRTMAAAALETVSDAAAAVRPRRAALHGGGENPGLSQYPDRAGAQQRHAV